jgi:lauroyl/myristoyl acyltransferase
VLDIVLRAYINSSLHLLELLLFLRIADERIREKLEEMFVGFRWKEKLEQALSRASKKGVGLIALGGHVGNWERGAIELARELTKRGFRLTVMAQPARTTYETELFDKIRKTQGIEVVEANPSGYRILRERLEQGQPVALLGDLRYPLINHSSKAGQDGLMGGEETFFFGQKALFPSGPFRLAQSTGSPILCAFCLREPRMGWRVSRYAIHVVDIIEVEKGKTAEESKACLRQSMQRWVSHYQEYVEMFFNQWNPLTRIFRE